MRQISFYCRQKTEQCIVQHCSSEIFGLTHATIFSRCSTKKSQSFDFDITWTNALIFATQHSKKGIYARDCKEYELYFRIIGHMLNNLRNSDTISLLRRHFKLFLRSCWKRNGLRYVFLSIKLKVTCISIHIFFLDIFRLHSSFWGNLCDRQYRNRLINIFSR